MATQDIASQVTTTYEKYKKIKQFEDVGYFLLPYVVSGGVVTNNIERNNYIDVTDIVASIDDNVVTRDGTSFKTSIPNSTYYLDFGKDGDWAWDTAHPSGSVGEDYITIATVTTDSNKNVLVITDTRGDTAGFRLKPGYMYPEIAELQADTVIIAPSGGDDTAIIQAAIDKLLNGGRIEFTNGDFNINSTGLDIYSNLKLIARGSVRFLSDNTILYINRGESGTDDVANNIKNILIEGITFEHITKSFSEFIPLLDLYACSNVEIKNCEFIGFKGDGIYLGGNTLLGAARHNENIDIHHCLFDGVNNQNRNGISIIDGNGVRIYKNKFVNCTKPGMPGAIDMEPNHYSFPIIKNILIEDNHFSDINGDGSVIVHTWSEMTNWSNNIVIRRNTFDSEVGEAIVVVSAKSIDTSTPLMQIDISHNTVNYGTVRLDNIKGANISDNLLNRLRLGSENSSTSSCADITEKNNIFSKTRDSVYCQTVCNVSRLEMDNNTYIDAQTGVLYFVLIYGNSVTTASDNITIANSKFIKGSSGVTDSVRVQNHTLNAATNRYLNNITDTTLLNSFNYQSDDFNTRIAYDTTKLPDSFSRGVEISIVNGDSALPSTDKQGVLATTRATTTTGFRRFTTQWFYPANNDATMLADMYFRKGADATNTWSAWKKITGA